MDYIHCALKFGCDLTEYLAYSFFLLNDRGRKEFLCRLQRFVGMTRDEQEREHIRNKEKSLAFFSDEISRDWCGFTLHNTPEEYQTFQSSHERCIVKPLSSSGGHGVELLYLRSMKDGELYDYCMKNHLLAEELIIQHHELAKLHPDSVNTVRMLTLDGKLIGAGLRMGMGGMNVDNGSSGGLSVTVDVDHGIVNSYGKIEIEEKPIRYIKHPDTAETIIGFQIPFWRECKEYVERLSSKLPGVPLIGWDIAVTENGPTLVELNSAPGIDLVQSINFTTLPRDSIKRNLYPIFRKH